MGCDHQSWRQLDGSEHKSPIADGLTWADFECLVCGSTCEGKLWGNHLVIFNWYGEKRLFPRDGMMLPPT